MQHDEVFDELMAVTRAALDPYFGESDTSVYAGLFGEEATYFDPNSSGKLKDNSIGEHFASFAGQVPPFRYEILNPDLSLSGETAVFTYNLDTFDRTDGSVTSRWNATQVHRRTESGWEMIHSHWSHTSPAG